MRKHFEAQYELGVVPIEETKFPKRSRDELPPVLKALQYVYCDKNLSTEVYAELQKCIHAKVTHRHLGRLGMSYWEILVMGVVRLTLHCDYDRLEHTVNYDKLVRSILGVERFGGEGKQYNLQTIKDNVGLLDDDTISKINEMVVRVGHRLVKKKRRSYASKSTVTL